jgi:peptidoglycan/xylan/chitin deacetylase (PgdA/CDA1 family)
LPILLSIADRWGIKRTSNNSPVFPYIEGKKHPKFQILIYHRVNDDNDPFFGGIPVKVFENQMEILYKYFNVYPLGELVERMINNDLPWNAIAITFDDGYKDNYDKAYPILKKYNLPATIFLTSGPIESKIPIWHDLVFDAFRRTNAKSIFLDGKDYPLHSVPEKIIVMNKVLQNLRKCNIQERDKLIQQIIFSLRVPEVTSVIEEMLSWQDIKEMFRNNITFGAHTVTHPILTQLSLTEAIDEIMTSKCMIEKRLGTTIKLFAYPNGGRSDFSEQIERAVQDAGFLCGVTTIWGNNDINTGLFELRRMQAWDFNPYMSALRLGWYKFTS